jgi:hypothetical protein
VAGYFGMPFHGDKKSMAYYYEGILYRDYVKCGTNEPLGTPLPTYQRQLQGFL